MLSLLGIEVVNDIDRMNDASLKALTCLLWHFGTITDIIQHLLYQDTIFSQWSSMKPSILQNSINFQYCFIYFRSFSSRNGIPRTLSCESTCVTSSTICWRRICTENHQTVYSELDSHDERRRHSSTLFHFIFQSVFSIF